LTHEPAVTHAMVFAWRRQPHSALEENAPVPSELTHEPAVTHAMVFAWRRQLPSAQELLSNKLIIPELAVA